MTLGPWPGTHLLHKLKDRVCCGLPDAFPLHGEPVLTAGILGSSPLSSLKQRAVGEVAQLEEEKRKAERPQLILHPGCVAVTFPTPSPSSLGINSSKLALEVGSATELLLSALSSLVEQQDSAS